MGRKHNMDKEQNLSPAMEKVAARMATGILLVQTKWARIMNRLFAKMSHRLQWFVFISVSVLMLALSVLLTIKGIKGNGQRVAIKVNASIPVIPLNPAPGPDRPSEKLQARIRNFRLTLDSLGRTKEGKMKLDSFFLRRPGLMDSINSIESIYKQRKD